MKLDWTNHCATQDNRNQCSKETCTMFDICKIKTPNTILVDKILKYIKRQDFNGSAFGLKKNMVNRIKEILNESVDKKGKVNK